jgi:hypothetical protein
MRKQLYVLVTCVLFAVGCQDDASSPDDAGFNLDTSVGDTFEEDTSSADWSSCEQPSDCTLAFDTCCGVCGVPTLDDYDAINANESEAHRREVCPDPQPCPECVAQPNPWLVATCASTTCQGVDLRQSDATRCTQDSECRLRTQSCCECGGDTSRAGLIAVSVSGDYQSIVCDPGTDCPACVPDYPDEAKAVCADDGHCDVVWE